MAQSHVMTMGTLIHLILKVVQDKVYSDCMQCKLTSYGEVYCYSSSVTQMIKSGWEAEYCVNVV